MCGIAGIVRLDGGPVDCADIKRMTDAIAHRGPDGEGQWCEGPVGLGHRRLAIIDLSEEAAQPMHSLDGRYVITYNGEVYNFRELRRELERSGSRFRSHSDTEVVLESVIRWGIDAAIRRFNGMFAFAIWDKQSRRLTLARDRYGIKPLYVWRSARTLAFASEVRGLTLLPEVGQTPDPLAIAEYMTFQNILSDRTFAKDVRVFPPAHFGVMDSAHGVDALELRRYWDFGRRGDGGQLSDRHRVEAIRHLAELLPQSVSAQLVADVKVSSYLSGGLDSGAITALAAAEVPRLKTFTCGFDLLNVEATEAGLDERAHAERLSRLFGTEHYEVVVGPQSLQRALPDIVTYMGEPRVGQSYPNYYAAKLASRFGKVVLAGTGGDEVFGGYIWRYPTHRASDDEFIREHFGLWNRLLPEHEVATLLKPLGVAPGDITMRDRHREYMNNLLLQTSDDSDRYLDASMAYEARTFLPGLLAVDDRLSMRFGLETRLPFLDNNLVDFVESLPRAWLIEDAEHLIGKLPTAPGPSPVGKSLLRAATAEILPQSVRLATKQGFTAPDGSWFARDNFGFLYETVAAANPSVVNVAAALDHVMNHATGRRRSRLLMWSLLVLARWSNTVDT